MDKNSVILHQIDLNAKETNQNLQLLYLNQLKKFLLRKNKDQFVKTI